MREFKCVECGTVWGGPDDFPVCPPWRTVPEARGWACSTKCGAEWYWAHDPAGLKCRMYSGWLAKFEGRAKPTGVSGPSSTYALNNDLPLFARGKR